MRSGRSTSALALLLLSALAVSSCGTASAPAGAGADGALWTARPAPVLAGYPDGESEGDLDAPDGAAFASGVGLRAGYTSYPGTVASETQPRALIGVYYHFAETERRRLEGAFAYAASGERPSDNLYCSMGLSYVGYIGETGFLTWSAGAGGLIERWYGEDHLFAYLDVALGYWVSMGQKGLDLRLDVQLPMGDGVNAPTILLFAVGYDI
jgi:hypothetical protein